MTVHLRSSRPSATSADRLELVELSQHAACFGAFGGNPCLDQGRTDLLSIGAGLDERLDEFQLGLGFEPGCA